jgi:Protein of unknown function (DUF2800)
MILTVEERPHARLSPSMLERVMRCTMSHRLSQTSTGGAPPVARESAIWGTAAHAVGEAVLLGHAELEEVECVYIEGERVPVDARMREAVRVWVDYVGDRPALIECKLTLPWSNIYGYADTIVGDEIIDFKSGFVAVHADSIQVALYLIAWLMKRYGSLELSPGGTTTIIQPRAQGEPIRSHVWTFAALRDLRDQLIETLDRLRRGDLSYAAGDHCRFCPAIASCLHLRAIVTDATAIRLAAPELIAQGEFGAQRLDAAMQLVPLVDAWCRSTAEVAKAYMADGGKLKNWKLVKKRTGSLTVTHRDDPRPEVSVSETLRAALRSSVARGYLEAANLSSE